MFVYIQKPLTLYKSFIRSKIDSELNIKAALDLESYYKLVLLIAPGSLYVQYTQSERLLHIAPVLTK